MQSSTAGARRRVLTTTGVAALTLSLGAALPAFADDHGSSADQSQSAQASQTGQAHRSDNASAGSTNSSQSNSSQSNSSQSNSSQSGSSTGSANSSTSHTSTANTADGHNPPGNNGTVFIKQGRDDSHPSNNPHVSCQFFVSFFGFDKSQTLTVSFAGQAPTGKDQAVPTTATTTITSTTDASGAGNDYDGFLGPFDGTNLDLSKLGTPQPQQGFHIKMTVDTGANVPGGAKYKVFWFQPCTTTSGSSVLPSTNDNSSSTVVGGTTGGATVLGESATRGTPTTHVLGVSLKRPTTTKVLGTTARRPTALPFTGAQIAALTLLALATLAGGTVLTIAGRRRRGRVTS